MAHWTFSQRRARRHPALPHRTAVGRRVRDVLRQRPAAPVQHARRTRGLTIGTSPGYLYSPDFSESTLFTREPAPTHEANFGKLLRGRIDLLITDRRVGQHLLDQLNIRDQITENPTVISRQSQYLAVRRNAGMDLLVRAAPNSSASSANRPTPSSAHATAPPGPPVNPQRLGHRKTVEQQESSAQ
jgi:polar amino acid transport system substrate-binding protein